MPVEQRWDLIDNPAALGYSAEGLDSVGVYAQRLSTDAIVVMVDGEVLMEYGDTHVLSYVASVRKSILAMLYGNYVPTERSTSNLRSKTWAWTTWVACSRSRSRPRSSI